MSDEKRKLPTYLGAPPAEARKQHGQPTAENKARRAYFKARNEAWQRHGIPAPSTGTFGKRPA